MVMNPRTNHYNISLRIHTESLSVILLDMQTARQILFNTQNKGDIYSWPDNKDIIMLHYAISADDTIRH